MVQTVTNSSNRPALEPVGRRKTSEANASTSPNSKPVGKDKKIEPVKRRETKTDLFGFEDFVSNDSKKKLKPVSEFILTPGNFYGLTRGSQTYTVLKRPIVNAPDFFSGVFKTASKVKPSNVKIATEFVKSEGLAKVAKIGTIEVFKGGKNGLLSVTRFAKDTALAFPRDIARGGLTIFDWKFVPITVPTNFLARNAFKPVKYAYQGGKNFIGSFFKFGTEKTYVVKKPNLFRTVLPMNTENGIFENEYIRAVEKGDKITQLGKPSFKSNFVLENDGFVKGSQFVSLNGRETPPIISGNRFWSTANAPEDGVVFLRNSRWNRIAGKFGKQQIFNVKQGDVIPGTSKFYKTNILPTEADYFIKEGTKVGRAIYEGPSGPEPMVMPEQRDGWVLGENAPGKTVSTPVVPPEATSFRETIGKALESPIKTLSPALTEWHASGTFKVLGSVGLVASIYGMFSSVREDGDAINSTDPQIRGKKRGYALDAGDYIPYIGKGWNLGIGRKTVINLGGFGGAIIGSQVGGYLGALAGVAVGGIGGAAAGIETGPGAAVTAAAGGLTAGAIGAGVGEFVGGAAGYWGGSTLTQHIWDATLGEDS